MTSFMCFLQFLPQPLLWFCGLGLSFGNAVMMMMIVCLLL